MRVAALFVWTGPDELVVLGRGTNVFFTASDSSDNVSLGTVEEGAYAAGRWLPGRRLNGDEAPEWRALRFPGDRYGIQQVKPYRYR
jgi:hypothetical protein